MGADHNSDIDRPQSDTARATVSVQLADRVRSSVNILIPAKQDTRGPRTVRQEKSGINQVKGQRIEMGLRIKIY